MERDEMKGDERKYDDQNVLKFCKHTIKKKMKFFKNRLKKFIS